MNPVLGTARLVLREIEFGDLGSVAAMLAHPRLMRYWPRCYSREEAENWIRRQQKRYARGG